MRTPLNALLFLICLTISESSRAGDFVRPVKKKTDKKEEPALLTFLDGKLVFDIEERVRGEIRDNNRDFDSSVHDDNDDSWLLNRFRLGLAVKPVSWLKLYGQTQDSREAFSDRANIPGVHGAEGDDIFDLRQASISLGEIKKFPLLLTLGRQAITYGDGSTGGRFKVGKLRADLRRRPAPLGTSVLFWMERLLHASGPNRTG